MNQATIAEIHERFPPGVCWRDICRPNGCPPVGFAGRIRMTANKFPMRLQTTGIMLIEQSHSHRKH